MDVEIPLVPILQRFGSYAEKRILGTRSPSREDARCRDKQE
jgi:hypothetical protein